MFNPYHTPFPPTSFTYPSYPMPGMHPPYPAQAPHWFDQILQHPHNIKNEDTVNILYQKKQVLFIKLCEARQDAARLHAQLLGGGLTPVVAEKPYMQAALRAPVAPQTTTHPNYVAQSFTLTPQFDPNYPDTPEAQAPVTASAARAKPKLVRRRGGLQDTPAPTAQNKKRRSRVCKFFDSESGCKKGEDCTYAHNRDAKTKRTQGTQPSAGAVVTKAPIKRVLTGTTVARQRRDSSPGDDQASSSSTDSSSPSRSTSPEPRTERSG